MPHQTVVNLKRLDNAAEKFGMPPGLEARFARVVLGMEKGGLSLFKLEPGYRFPWGHRHRDQEEVYLVLEGSAEIVFEDGSIELGAWDAVRLPPEILRSFRAGPDGLQMLVFGSGERGDAEMDRDFW